GEQPDRAAGVRRPAILGWMPPMRRKGWRRSAQAARKPCPRAIAGRASGLNLRSSIAFLPPLRIAGIEGRAAVVRVSRISLMQRRDVSGLQRAVEDARVREPSVPVMSGAAGEQVADPHPAIADRAPGTHAGDLASLRAVDVERQCRMDGVEYAGELSPFP